MLLWAVLTVALAIVVAASTIPLVRRYERRASDRDATMAVLRDQLADVDAQAANGAVDASQAEALRTEVKRRMLTASREREGTARPLGTAALGRLGVGLAAGVAVAATALYATLGRPDLAATPGTAPGAVSGVQQTAAGPPAQQAPDIGAMIAQLETRMSDNPGDAEGWRMLGWSYFQTSAFQKAADAYAKAIALAPNGEGYASAYGEALVQAAGGKVTPAAAQQFEAAKRLDAKDARARYFLGVAKAEGGDRKAALDDWFALIAEAPADAEYVPELQRIIAETARTAGIDVTARLAATQPRLVGVSPAPAGVAPGVLPAPTPEQMAQVQAMPAGDQQAMIRGMVDGLAAKLKANPRDSGGWVRLMRARMVLGDAAAASAARRDALAALQGDAAAMAEVTQAATALGVPAA